MTPEEAAQWADQQPEHRNPRAVLNEENSCMCKGCMAPIYLDSMCADHWRLLLGYPGHARIRDHAEKIEAAKQDPLVLELERLFAL